MNDLRGRVLCGDFCHAPVQGEVEFLTGALIALDAAGAITEVIKASDPAYAARKAAAEAQGLLIKLDGLILPGFVDLHVHAPQFPQLGRALDVPLEVWLQTHTFPLEARYADLDFARRSYEGLVGALLSGGTTTAMYFASIHAPATKLLADICLAQGQRALIGKVAMDNPDECPDFYRDASVSEAVENTRAVNAYIHALPSDGRVLPVITPRFAPSCTDALLQELGDLARSSGAHVQTHCAESDWQQGYAWARFGISDASALDRFGLIGRRSILAHANFLSDADMDLIAGRGAGIAHCPYSNMFFSDAVFPLRRALAKGLRVGLGTDVSGGPSASMLHTIRMTVAASRMLESGVRPDLKREDRATPDSRVDIGLAFHLATAGAGDALDLPIGKFAPGYRFDAMRIDPAAEHGAVHLIDIADERDRLDMILFNAAHANIAQVWVDGRTAG